MARYNEDLGWLDGLSFQPRVLVYNKGDAIDAPALAALNPRATAISLPNVGRESQSYLHHIVANYDDLADVTIFVQGRINDLGANVFPDLADYLAPAVRDGFSASDLELFFSNMAFDIDIHGKLMRDPRYRAGIERGDIEAAGGDIREFAAAFLGPLPPVMVVSFSGCFAVSRDAVRGRPKAFYETLLKALSRHRNPEIGHYMERLWCAIFSGNRLLGKAVRLVPRRLWWQLVGKGSIAKTPAAALP
ncbi:MAG: DUF3431 domain-containing protein [Acetobacteraceae bacterium]|nr:DUF3431 domain-containing protein [Acetobacteraceae bacterium]